MMEIQIPDHISHVYFVGIGGIGMSALAQYFRSMGVSVAGYDADRSAVIEALVQDGIVVHHTEEESVSAVAPDLVVYTPAVPESHKGLRHFRDIGLPVLKRSQVLGWISQKHRCIAVAGTHGKTTTSAMLTYVLRKCGVDVTAFLGGIVPDLKGNFVQGTSEWMVAEADEYDRSFLALSPEIAVVTAMDADHLDIYGDYDSMVAGYVGFLNKVQEGGKVILHNDVKARIGQETWGVLERKNIRLITFGTENAEYCISDLKKDATGSMFHVDIREGEHGVVKVQMPGLHNALNAMVSVVVGDILGISQTDVVVALQEFKGIKRRFEVVYSDERHTLIDDYAHHPKELSAAISAARLQYPDQKITGVFQPHLYSRTKDFYQEFAEALSALDTSILVELYPARELPVEGVSSKMIFEQIKHESKYLTTKKELIPLLESLNPEVLLLLGAGDLDRMSGEIIERLKAL